MKHLIKSRIKMVSGGFGELFEVAPVERQDEVLSAVNAELRNSLEPEASMADLSAVFNRSDSALYADHGDLIDREVTEPGDYIEVPVYDEVLIAELCFGIIWRRQ